MSLSVFRTRARLKVTSFQTITGDTPVVVVFGESGYESASEVLVNGQQAPAFYITGGAQLIATLPTGVDVATTVDVFNESASRDDVSVALSPGTGVRLQTVRGVAYVIQKVVKALSSRAGSDTFNIDLGGGLTSLLASARPRNELPSLISNVISTTVERLRTLETDELPAAERIGNVRASRIAMSTDTIFIELEVSNALGETGKARVST